MVFTDLDGTLFQKEQRISARNLETLTRLGGRGILRVIATGRNLHSLDKVIPRGFPVDYAIFSSGAGVMEWRTRSLIRAVSMGASDVRDAFAVHTAEDLDFMIHWPVPDNHRLIAFPTGRSNADFARRESVYRDFAVTGNRNTVPAMEASQFVAMEPRDGAVETLERVRRALPGLSVIRATSPFGSGMLWIEVFASGVSKSKAAAWLASRCGVERARTLAVGNDHNDEDLLRWAASSYVVSACPAELASSFPQASSGDESDFAEAVRAWELTER